MVYVELIARLLLFSKEILYSYSGYLAKMHFRDVIVTDLIKGILESWSLFNEVKVDYLKERFKDRDDIDLFMRRVSEANVEGDGKFAVWWIGKTLSEMVMAEVKQTENIEKARDMVVLALELKEVSEGKVNPVTVWDFGSDLKARIENKNTNKPGMKTGISLLDEQVTMTEGTVTVFVAPWKRYKSILLTNIGAAALAQGKSVFHVHYEGRKQLWEMRYDSCLSGVAYSRLYSQMSESEREKIEKVYAKLGVGNTHLYFMGATPGSAGLVEIMSELEGLKRQGINFDVVVIDYLNLMKSSRGHEEDWKEQGQIAWDLVKLSQRGYTVVTAVQAKMEAATREVLKENDLGRSVVIAQATTSLIAINQNPTEKEQGCIRLSPLNLREKEITKKIIPLEMCLWKMRISREVDAFLNKAFEDEKNEEL